MPETIIQTFVGTDRRGRAYQVEVYEDGPFAGDRHICDGRTFAENRWRQSAEDAVTFIRDRWWPMAVAFGQIAPPPKR